MPLLACSLLRPVDSHIVCFLYMNLAGGDISQLCAICNVPRLYSLATFLVNRAALALIESTESIQAVIAYANLAAARPRWLTIVGSLVCCDIGDQWRILEQVNKDRAVRR